jgi:hypothetical protein
MISNQEQLFYDGPYDSLEKSIALSGKTRKHIAEAVYPGRQPETAKSLLSRALSPENTDVHLNIENLKVILRETRPDDFIFWLCDEFGFERPRKKTSDNYKQDLAKALNEINLRLKILSRALPDEVLNER